MSWRKEEYVFWGYCEISPRHLILIFRYWFPLKERRGSETTVNIVLKRELYVSKNNEKERNRRSNKRSKKKKKKICWRNRKDWLIYTRKVQVGRVHLLILLQHEFNGNGTKNQHAQVSHLLLCLRWTNLFIWLFNTR